MIVEQIKSKCYILPVLIITGVIGACICDKKGYRL